MGTRLHSYNRPCALLFSASDTRNKSSSHPKRIEIHTLCAARNIILRVHHVLRGLPRATLLFPAGQREVARCSQDHNQAHTNDMRMRPIKVK